MATGEFLARRLRELGLEVQHPVAHTGVVAVLRGGRPGPVVALRSDIDALPVTEEVDVPFRSDVRTTFDGRDVALVRTQARVYDLTGRLWQDLTSTALDTQATVYSYDGNGNQTRVAAPLGRVTVNAYDES